MVDWLTPRFHTIGEKFVCLIQRYRVRVMVLKVTDRAKPITKSFNG